jgi:hypothetical protein
MGFFFAQAMAGRAGITLPNLYGEGSSSPPTPSYSRGPAVDHDAVNEAGRKQRSLTLSSRGSSGSILTPGLSTMGGSAPVAQKTLLGV